MSIKYTLIQLGRNDKTGKYCKQIKLGDDFFNQVKKMSESIYWLGNSQNAIKEEIYSLNYKLNRILVNKIEFECKGIDFNKTDFKDAEIISLKNVAVTISQNLCAFIDDFENNRQSGDPMVWKDCMVFLMTIYAKIQWINKKQKILSAKQIDMLEEQFIECFSLFNDSINQAIIIKNWAFAYNCCSAFFGGDYFFPNQSSYPDNYLQNCYLSFEEVKDKKLLN